MPNFETGVPTMSKTKVDLKNRVKNGRSNFWDDFEIFRKFREHFISNIIFGVLANGWE